MNAGLIIPETFGDFQSVYFSLKKVSAGEK